jgi:hypothetical protein
MSKPQLRAKRARRSISSKRRDTTIWAKIDYKAVCAFNWGINGVELI